MKRFENFYEVIKIGERRPEIWHKSGRFGTEMGRADPEVSQSKNDKETRNH